MFLFDESKLLHPNSAIGETLWKAGLSLNTGMIALQLVKNKSYMSASLAAEFVDQ